MYGQAGGLGAVRQAHALDGTRQKYRYAMAGNTDPPADMVDPDRSEGTGGASRQVPVGLTATPMGRVLASMATDKPLAELFVGTVPGTLMETLGISVVAASHERVVATMPVGPAQHQPYGLLHGGASVALAETVASVGACLRPDGAIQNVVGLEINANHMRAVRSGTVTAVGQPLHQGKSTQVWSIEITDDEGRLVCVSRCTLAVLG